MSAFTRRAPHSLHRIHVIAELEHHQAQVLATVAREVQGNLDDERGKHIPTATELRGIPAIGRGVAGVINGTQPHRIAS